MLDIREMSWISASSWRLFCPALKGILLMEMLPVTICARLLGIHPKTFTHWLTQANFPFAPHPTDARIKCVAQEHFREVARRHDRPLQSSAPSVFLDGASLPSSSQNHVLFAPEHDATSFQTDLLQKLSCLETKVATLQEHLAQLALALLKERERKLIDVSRLWKPRPVNWWEQWAFPLRFQRGSLRELRVSVCARLLSLDCSIRQSNVHVRACLL